MAVQHLQVLLLAAWHAEHYMNSYEVLKVLCRVFTGFILVHLFRALCPHLAASWQSSVP